MINLMSQSLLACHSPKMLIPIVSQSPRQQATEVLKFSRSNHFLEKHPNRELITGKMKSSTMTIMTHAATLMNTTNNSSADLSLRWWVRESIIKTKTLARTQRGLITTNNKKKTSAQLIKTLSSKFYIRDLIPRAQTEAPRCLCQLMIMCQLQSSLKLTLEKYRMTLQPAVNVRRCESNWPSRNVR